MLDKILPNTTLDYLEGNKDCNGDYRPSIMVGGNPDILRRIEKNYEKFGIKNPSLTFVFRDPASEEELGGRRFTDDLIDRTLEMLFPGVPPENIPSWAAYLHKNKANHYELNLRVVQVYANKKFTLYLHKRDLHLRKAFSDKLHKDYPKLTYPNSKIRLFDYARTWNDNAKEICLEANTIVSDGLKKNQIHSRHDVENALVQAGMEIEPRKNYIRVKCDKGIIRLKGKILEPDFQFNGEQTIAHHTVSLDKDEAFYDKQYNDALSVRKSILKVKYEKLYKQRYRKNKQRYARRYIKETRQDFSGVKSIKGTSEGGTQNRVKGEASGYDYFGDFEETGRNFRERNFSYVDELLERNKKRLRRISEELSIKDSGVSRSLERASSDNRTEVSYHGSEPKEFSKSITEINGREFEFERRSSVSEVKYYSECSRHASERCESTLESDCKLTPSLKRWLKFSVYWKAFKVLLQIIKLFFPKLEDDTFEVLMDKSLNVYCGTDHKYNTIDIKNTFNYADKDPAKAIEWLDEMYMDYKREEMSRGHNQEVGYDR